MTAATPRLQVLIVTHRPDGINRVEAMHLPRVESVGYVISWQNHGNAPVPEAIASRDDIIVSRCDHAGVSANRNNAFEAATAPVVLVGDDDLAYSPDALKEIIRIFDTHPGLDFATFRYDGGDNKQYPPAETSLTPIPPGFHLTAFETAIRRGPRTQRLRFREDFGPGAPRFIAGEDDMLLVTAVKLGLTGRFFPLTIARHEGVTTGYRPITDPRVAQTTGAIIKATHPGPAGWIPRMPLTAWRLWRGGRMSFFPALKHLVTGALAYRETP